MKKRIDYVTNSSSSSFIITNKTDKYMTSKDVILALMSKILEDSDGRFELAPGEQKIIICGDCCSEDGYFEAFIHNQAGSWSGYLYENDFVSVEFDESYH